MAGARFIPPHRPGSWSRCAGSNPRVPFAGAYRATGGWPTRGATVAPGRDRRACPWRRIYVCTSLTLGRWPIPTTRTAGPFHAHHPHHPQPNSATGSVAAVVGAAAADVARARARVNRGRVEAWHRAIGPVTAPDRPRPESPLSPAPPRGRPPPWAGVVLRSTTATPPSPPPPTPNGSQCSPAAGADWDTRCRASARLRSDAEWTLTHHPLPPDCHCHESALCPAWPRRVASVVGRRRCHTVSSATRKTDIQYIKKTRDKGCVNTNPCMLLKHTRAFPHTGSQRKAETPPPHFEE